MDRYLGKRLRRLRAARGLSQAELAEPHYTHAYVSSIEAGRRIPSHNVLQHFAERLGVDVEELTRGQPPRLRERLELTIQEARHSLSSGDRDAAEERYQEVLGAARKWGVRRAEAKALHGLALCLERRGKWDDAIEAYDVAEAVAQEGDADVHADVVAGKARCVEALGDRGHAIYLLDRTIRDLKRRGLDDPLAMIKLLAPLAYSAAEAGFERQAREAAAQALALETSVEDPLTLAVTHMNVARSLIDQRQREGALRSLNKSEELFDLMDLKLELARCHLAQGIALRVSDAEHAGRHLERSLAAFEEIGSDIDRARALVELGRLERREGRTRAAVTRFNSAIDLLRKSEYVGELALAHRELGLAYSTDDIEKAEKNLREAVTLYERAEQPIEAALTYRYIGDAFEAVGRDGCAEFRNAARALPTD